MIRKSNQTITYPIALLLSTSFKKNFESLAREHDMSGESVSRLLTTTPVTMQELISFCKTIFKNKPLYLLIDDTLINKWYSRVIEGACDNFDTSDRKSYRSLCSVVAMITDRAIAIPIDQALWVSLEYNTVNYAKKWEIAQKLIARIRPYVRIKRVAMDGLYRNIIADILYQKQIYSIN